jgi:Zn-dependent peptidase ImmA (M78 family)
MKASTAKTKAERLAQKIWQESGSRVPVDLNAIAAEHQIAIKTEVMEADVSGMMVTSEGGVASILVNGLHASVRQNFSTAHELGHYFLHRATSPVFVDSKNGAQVFFRDGKAAAGTHYQEIEANAFAAELLMPEREVRKVFPEKISAMELDYYEEKIGELAKDWQVSKSALTIRLNRLGITD